MADALPDFLAILRVLVKHDVDFIVVGGVAAVIQGVPVTTADLDVVHRRSEENVERLLAALDELQAVSRLDARGLRPNATQLMSPGHQFLKTRAGLFDVLGELAGAQGYDALLPGTEEVDIEGNSVSVLSFEQLVETKTGAGRAKDLAALLLIRHAQEERKRGS